MRSSTSSKNVLGSDNFETDYFSRLKETSFSETNTEQGGWVSWKKLVDEEGEEVVNAMIEDNTIITRPHQALKPYSASTLASPPHLRLQYKHVKETDTSSCSESHRVKQYADNDKKAQPSALNTAPPADIEAEQEEQRKKDTIKAMSAAKRAHNVTGTSLTELKIRLDKFKDNE